jgi:hypothetical protein
MNFMTPADTISAERVEVPEVIFKPTPFVWRDPARHPNRKWLYGTSYQRKFVSALVAPPGVGKSSLALVEAIAMASGKNLLGFTPRQRCRVWYCNLEDPLEEIIRRVLAICLHYGLEPSDLEGWLFLDGSETKIVVARETRDETTVVQPVVDALIKAIKDGLIDVLVIDPFVRSHKVKENSNEAIDRVVDPQTGRDRAHQASKTRKPRCLRSVVARFTIALFGNAGGRSRGDSIS